MKSSGRINAKRPEPIDIAMGERIRLQRRLRGMSQEMLARAIGVSFQQLQKYEKGKNRIGASRLRKVAECLAIPLSYLFSGKPFQPGFRVGSSELAERAAISRFLETEEGQELNLAFRRIESPEVKKRIVHLVKAIAMTGVKDRKGEPRQNAANMTEN